jgi:hypothetical protein
MTFRQMGQILQEHKELIPNDVLPIEARITTP